MSGFKMFPFSQSIFTIPIGDDYTKDEERDSYNSFVETTGSLSSVSSSESHSEMVFVGEFLKPNWNVKIQQKMMYSKYKLIQKLMKC